MCTFSEHGIAFNLLVPEDIKSIFKKECAAWPNGMQHRFNRGIARNPCLFPTYHDTKNLSPPNISVVKS
jgi:hypothetical protein